MAEVLPELPRSGNASGGGAMYAQYMDGQVWKLIQCEDFDCSVETLRARIGTYARGRGMRVRTRTIKEDPPALAVQAYKPEEER